MYYGMVMPDSSIVVFRMTQCGMDKTQVTFVTDDPLWKSVSVSDVTRTPAVGELSIVGSSVT